MEDNACIPLITKIALIMSSYIFLKSRWACCSYKTLSFFCGAFTPRSKQFWFKFWYKFWYNIGNNFYTNSTQIKFFLYSSFKNRRTHQRKKQQKSLRWKFISDSSPITDSFPASASLYMLEFKNQSFFMYMRLSSWV